MSTTVTINKTLEVQFKSLFVRRKSFAKLKRRRICAGRFKAHFGLSGCVSGDEQQTVDHIANDYALSGARPEILAREKTTLFVVIDRSHV